jgi:hypothetical protein
MGCDTLVGIHVINPPPDAGPTSDAGGDAGDDGASGVVCSAAALSCAACLVCGEVVDVVFDDFGAPTSPTLPLTGSTAGDNRVAVLPSVECKQADGPERVYAVSVNKDGFLTAKLSREGTSFDSVLYARKSCCNTNEASTHCNDSKKAAGDHSALGGEVISFRVAKGDVWFLVVDGDDSAQAGSYTLDLNLSLGSACADGRWVPVSVDPGAPLTLSGNTQGLGSDGANRCFLGHAAGAGSSSEIVYELRASPGVSAFDLAVHGDFDAVLYARRACVDSNFVDTSEIVCEDASQEPIGELIKDLPYEGAPIYVFVDSGPLPGKSYDYTLTVIPK